VSSRRLRCSHLALGLAVLGGCDGLFAINEPTTASGDSGTDASVDASGEAQSAGDAADVVDVADAESRCSQQDGCTTFPQSGCPANENCQVTTTSGGTGCGPLGLVGLWQNCQSVFQCGKGAECIGLACKPFCCAASDCTGGAHATCEYGVAGGVPIPGLLVCSAGCDLMAPSAICGPNVTCMPAPLDGKGMDHGDCYGGAGQGIGPGACVGKMNSPPPCAPGYYCMANGDCAKWCRLTHAEDCTLPQTCTGFGQYPPTIGGVGYGVCM